MYEGDLPPSNIMQAAVRQIARDAEDEERWGDEDCGNGDQSSFVEDGVEDLETNAIEGGPLGSGSLREGGLALGMSSESLLLASTVAQPQTGNIELNKSG